MGFAEEFIQGYNIGSQHRERQQRLSQFQQQLEDQRKYHDLNAKIAKFHAELLAREASQHAALGRPQQTVPAPPLTPPSGTPEGLPAPPTIQMPPTAVPSPGAPVSGVHALEGEGFIPGLEPTTEYRNMSDVLAAQLQQQMAVESIKPFTTKPGITVHPLGLLGPQVSGGPAVTGPEAPLGSRIPQLNSLMEGRYQVLHPGQKLPDSYKLPANATQKDFDRIDKVLNASETAAGTQAQRETANAIRQQTFALAQEKQAERLAAIPNLADVTKTTMGGNKYVDLTELQGQPRQIVTAKALAAGIPVADKDTANVLVEIDTAKQNLQYMVQAIGSKLAQGAGERLWYGPKNTIEKMIQSDPDMAAVGTYRNAAIQTMRAVAGARGLRINRAEVQLAIDNDIPKLTDTLPVAQAKLRNLNAFLNDSERAHLIRNRAAITAAPAAAPAAIAPTTIPRKPRTAAEYLQGLPR